MSDKLNQSTSKTQGDSKSTNQQLSNQLSSEFLRQMELDREWSHGDELNNAGSPVLEAAIKAGVNVVLEKIKEATKK
ncbi:hypothetical protein FBZ83_102531 [Azospirillum brasilense]|uniref:Uncharacterized protein n=1 Tax=Azospirillum brasilense TaxID=192 RepID=A0A560CPF4_AZOBR|nr:hypothetical protein [Azospirillum brasilense]TWA86734.1 hypothetical protein FBZ83_102531 [Azospirillum brasilense]